MLAKPEQAAQPLARDGDRSWRRSPASATASAGFINNADTAAEATAERSADLEAGFQKLPASCASCA